MNNKNTKTDLAKLDALTDEDIVYDEDTGAPFTDAEVDKTKGFTSNGMEDFRKKMREQAAKK